MPDFSYLNWPLLRCPSLAGFACPLTSGRVFEVNLEKEVVWEFKSDIYSSDPVIGNNNVIFRAHRYDLDYPGLAGKI